MTQPIVSEAASYVMRGYFPHMSSIRNDPGERSMSGYMPSHRSSWPNILYSRTWHAVELHWAQNVGLVSTPLPSWLASENLCFITVKVRKNDINQGPHAEIFTEMLPNAHILPFESDHVDRKGFLSLSFRIAFAFCSTGISCQSQEIFVGTGR
ncbi:hypothetical protein BC826DRAFT_1008406 [Russula brevipes]|nr:hypothetical protein BC826DRAFT_1008406 [Russula brevipes]